MNPTTAATPPANPTVPGRPRWWLRGLLLGIALAIAAPLAVVSYQSFSAQGAWAEAEEEASRDDPRWRLMEIEADRPQLADADNSALHIRAVRRMGRLSVGSVPNYQAIFEKLPTNAQLNAQQDQLIRSAFAKNPGQIEAARKLKAMPAGRFAITYSDDFVTTSIPHAEDVREVADMLKHDAVLLAQDGDCDGAVESCQAIINAGRSMKDDPLLVACLVRVNIQSIALDTLERVLAQGEASEEHLRAMQAMLEQEMRQDSFIQGTRGERAGTHYRFENQRAGKVESDIFLSFFGGAPASILHHMNRTVAAAKLPLHERPAKFAELHEEIMRSKNPVLKMLVPAMEKVEKADRRTHIYLRTMVVALACERYRLRDEGKRWPATLDELVKAKLLDALPTDPIDNQPLRYRRTKEGLVLYSIGFDLKDDQGNINREQPYAAGVDLGFRLWDPELRRRQPLPPVRLPAAP